MSIGFWQRAPHERRKSPRRRWPGSGGPLVSPPEGGRRSAFSVQRSAFAPRRFLGAQKFSPISIPLRDLCAMLSPSAWSSHPGPRCPWRIFPHRQFPPLRDLCGLLCDAFPFRLVLAPRPTVSLADFPPPTPIPLRDLCAMLSPSLGPRTQVRCPWHKCTSFPFIFGVPQRSPSQCIVSPRLTFAHRPLICQRPCLSTQISIRFC